MLIFQLYLPHVVPNNMQALRALIMSYSQITFWRALFHINIYGLKHSGMTKSLYQNYVVLSSFSTFL